MGYSVLLDLINEEKDQELNKLVTKLKERGYFSFLEKALLSLKHEVLYKSRVHGQGHIERACFYGSLLASDLKLNEEDTRLLLTACSYHDIGRIDDWLDNEHGERAAERVGEVVHLSSEDLNIVKAALKAHCLDNKLVPDIVREFNVKDTERGEKIARLLKDSDVLDRVRVASLDPKYLCFEESKQYLYFDEHFVEITKGLYSDDRSLKVKINERARKLKHHLPIAYLAMKDPEVAWYIKALAGVTVAYALSPIDLIPDFIPVLGYLDDVLILPLLVEVIVNSLPKKKRWELAERSMDMWKDGKPKKWQYGVPIIIFWLLILGLIIKAIVKAVVK